MDVLKPEIRVINGINYRINPGGDQSFSGDKSFDRYEEEDAVAADCLEVSAEDEEADIELLSSGRYSASLHVPKSYFSYIIGSKGATKKRLETETSTKITIPKQGLSGPIVINGSVKRNVGSARRRIRLMVNSARLRRPPTHFLSIPLNKPSIMSGFLKFKEEVLDGVGGSDVTEDLFQSADRLHLTLGLLVLSDEAERQEAAAALEECKQQVIRDLLRDEELRIEMSGIDIMNDDPSRVQVLYGKVKAVENDFLLQEIADGVLTFFSDKGLLVRKKQDHVKLHCTLMNSTFLESEVQTPFDASLIIKNYSEFYFGSDRVDSIQLSTFHSSTKDSYYKSSAYIEIP